MTSILSEATARRLDGRAPNELRPMACRLNVYPHADGSSMVRMGNTLVLCAVYGPHECKYRGRQNDERVYINCQYSMATFSTRERKNRPRGDRRSADFRSRIQKAFDTAIVAELYPRSQIDIFCEIIQADGANLAACINAASLALCEAGIAMRDVVSACCCSILPTPLATLKNPDTVSHDAPSSSVTVSSEASTESVTCIYDCTNSEESAGSRF